MQTYGARRKAGPVHSAGGYTLLSRSGVPYAGSQWKSPVKRPSTKPIW